jgi:uncharacterized protein YbjT (DUF2867 family)
MISVLGATGNTGGRVAARLAEAGEQVRAVSRSGRAVPGAEPWQGDATDRDFLTRAFAGADAAYVLLPFDLFNPDYHATQDRLGEAVTESLRAAGVPYVVALSSLGAEVPAGTGYLTALHRQEQRLRTLDAGILFLRPGLFFESFLHSLDAMRAEGVHADTIDADVRLPMVATRDVGDAAADALLTRTRTGVRELLGPAELTVPEALADLGARLGCRTSGTSGCRRRPWPVRSSRSGCRRTSPPCTSR